MPTVDPRTGRNETSYQRAADYFKHVKTGLRDPGPAGRYVVDKLLPWCQLGKGAAFDPLRADPPKLDEIAASFEALAPKAKKASKQTRSAKR